MGSLYSKKFKKYGYTAVEVGIWNTEDNTFSIGNKLYQVVKRESTSKQYEPEWEGSYANGDGGYIKGKGKWIYYTTTWYFCYTQDNVLVGVINTIDNIFQDNNRKQLYLLNDISPKFKLKELA